MKKRFSANISPVLVELIVVILFFALSCSVLIRLIAAASSLSADARSGTDALLALQDEAELIKADPQGDGNFSDGIRSFSVQREDGVTVEAVITRTRTAAGEYYDILLTAYARGKEVATLNAGRYVPGKAEGQ